MTEPLETMAVVVPAKLSERIRAQAHAERLTISKWLRKAAEEALAEG